MGGENRGKREKRRDENRGEIEEEELVVEEWIKQKKETKKSKM